MNRYEAMIARRTEARRRKAQNASKRVLDALQAEGIDIRVFGSLANGTFRKHSDVDFLVRGTVTSRIRVAVESTVACVMSETGLPIDIVYLDDLTPDQAAAFDRA